MKGRTMNSAGILHSMIWRRKKNYLFLFVSIFLSTFLAVSMVVLTSCGMASIDEHHKLRNGTQDLILFHVRDLINFDEQKEMGRLDEVGFAYLHAYTLPDGENLRDGFALAHYDEKGMELAWRKLKEGRMPQRAGEIAVEATALRKAGLQDAKPGDTISLTLTFGNDHGEFLADTEVREYTLTGILQDQRKFLDQWGDGEPLFRDFPAAVVTSDDVMMPGASLIRNALIVARNNADLPMWIYAESGLRDEIFYQYTDANFTSNEEIRPKLVPFIGIGVILLLVCGFGIVAAFTTTIEERTRQLGLLRAVGATSRQIRNMLLGQTAIMTLAAIPVGMLVALGVCYAITCLLGEDFLFRMDGLTVLVSVLFTFVCVGISSWLPLHKASHISPMQAIRDVEMQHAMRRGHVKSARHFSVGGHMAKRSLLLHKGQWIGAVALTIVTVLIISMGFPLTTYMISNINASEMTYDYGLSMNRTYGDHWEINDQYPYEGFRESVVQRLQTIFAGNQILYVRHMNVFMQVDEVTEYASLHHDHHYVGYTVPYEAGAQIRYLEDIGQQYQNVMKLYGFPKPAVSSGFVTVSDPNALRNAVVLEGKINPEKLASGEEVLVYAPYWAYRIHEDGHGWTSRSAVSLEELCQNQYGEIFDRYLANDMVHAGDVVDLSFITSPDKAETDGNGNVLFGNYDRKDRSVRIGAIIASSGLNVGYIPGMELLSILTADSAMDVWGWEKPEHDSIFISLNQSPDEDTQEYYDSVLTEIAELTDQSHFYNDIESNIERRERLIQTLITGAGIVLLFFACTASMMNRILSAQIRNAARMIGMLRAVGAEKGTVVRMFALQVITVVGIGAVLSMAGGMVFYLWNADFYPLEWMIPVGIGASLAYTAALMGVCLLHIRDRLDRIYRASVTENIREF